MGWWGRRPRVSIPTAQPSPEAAGHRLLLHRRSKCIRSALTAGPWTPGKSACPSPLGNLLACPLPAATLLKSADLCFSVWSAPNSVFLICLLSSSHSQPTSTPWGGGEGGRGGGEWFRLSGAAVAPAPKRCLAHGRSSEAVREAPGPQREVVTQAHGSLSGPLRPSGAARSPRRL